MDPTVKGRTGINRWGGSGDIGGSPRDSGTRLSPEQIVSACRDVIEKRSDIRHVKRFLTSAAFALLVVVAAIATGQNWHPLSWFGWDTANICVQTQMFGFHLALLVFSTIMLTVVAWHRPWQFGIMLPTGKDWWLILPFAILCGLTGDILVPRPSMFIADTPTAWIMALVLIPLSLELLFRSLVHGMMARLATIQDSESKWFFSGPTIGSSLLYVVVVGLQMNTLSAVPLMESLTNGILVKYAVVAVIFGLGAGMIRERSHSILPAWLFHAVAVATLLLIYGPV
jgi:hypothetical protein